MDDARRGPGEPVTPESLLATIDEARAFVAVQPVVVHGPTVHWLDQGSSRLARQASIVDLQRVWDDAQVDAVGREAWTDPIDHEASRLFRLAVAMAIVAKVDLPAGRQVDR